MDVAERLAAAIGIQKVPSARLSLFIRRRFLDAGECARLVSLIDERRRPSTIADDLGDRYFRTSETCDLDASIPEVAALDQRIASLTGLDPGLGEPIQGQFYAVGQEFKPHTDYFEPDGADYQRFCTKSGQRTWTVMIYLNEPEAGGATRFRSIDKKIQPETGKLLAWNNLRPDGRVDPDSLHHGMKVRAGTKYIVTKWYRERPWQW